MEVFRAAGAFTASHLELQDVVAAGTSGSGSTAWRFAVRYFGPTESVAWLQDRIQNVAASVGAQVTTQTFTARDITGRF